MKDFLEIFASKRLLKIIREFFSFSVKSFQKYLYVTALCAFLPVVLLFLQNPALTVQDNYWKVILILFISNLPATLLNYHKNLKLPKSDSPFNVAICEVVMLEDKEYMTLNIDTLKINQRLSSSLKNLSDTKYPYKANICRLTQVERPKLFYLTKTLPSIIQYWQKVIQAGKTDIILFCTCDMLSKKVEFDIFFRQGELANTNIPFAEFKIVFDKRINESQDMEVYIVGVFQFFTAICGQAVLDVMICFGDFTTAHKVVDDAETLLKESMIILKEFFETEKQEKFSSFCSLWLCGFERYRSLIFLHQKEYSGALSHVIRAAKLWPYYPYRNYTEYKTSFEKKYMAEINLKASEFVGELDEEAEDDQENQARSAQMLFQGLDLLDRVDNPDTPSTEQIIKWIMAEANSEAFYNEVEKVMDTEICAFPIDRIIKSEVLKYIPKGNTVNDSLYLDRIPEILILLNEILEKESDLTIIHLKIGMLMFIKSCHEENEQEREGQLKEAMAVMKKGMILYHRMGTI